MTAASKMVQLRMPFMPVLGDAVLSDDGVYRYSLSRSLDHLGAHETVASDGTPRRRCLFIMLNPSTADALKNDPTVEKCVKLARSARVMRGPGLAGSVSGVWEVDVKGHHVLDIGNLFAFRATSPIELRSASCRPIGPDNDRHLRELVARAHTVVLAWGKHGSLFGRDQEVLALLEGKAVHCIRENMDGSPVHPLYQRDDSSFVPWVGKR